MAEPSQSVIATRFIRSEAGAVVLWVAASLILGAAFAPWLYQAGKAFAGLAAEHAFTGFSGWLGDACQRASFGRFFNRSVLVASVLLIPLLFRRLRCSRCATTLTGPCDPPQGWATGMLHGGMGLMIASGIVWGLGIVLLKMNVFSATPGIPALKQLVLEALLPAAGVSVVEEWLFRGMLLGLWLRAARPVTACLGSSLVFALLHFIALPTGVVMTDPSSAAAGFRQLGGILVRLTQPGFHAAEFLTLFVMGMALAGARLRTGRLSLAIGMHFGWVTAFKIYNLTHLKEPGGPLGDWWIGGSLRSGLLPMIALGLTAWACHVMLKTCRHQSTVKPP